MKPFEDYVKEGIVSKEARSINRARELINNARVKLDLVAVQELSPETAPFRFMGAYEVMNDCISSLMALDGYATESHGARVSYIEDKYQGYYGTKLVRSLAQYTGFRNDIVNRAISVNVDQAAEAIRVAREFLRVTRDIVSAKLTILV
ncbi:hypothetical protein [Methanocella arvoryzae]|uniref:HEPN domain-containing protein n=1 Tax=Methanocella arvoryzae (strain DSM 22066 / NBRC 105507 / MRE50) TaxID=351160 RepID=Q0W219_METAR|nr:hypothetical protein [Methanocella arvoryzae]CAJ37574.1 hypothetical protein RCIX2507 [Methanocella arvoryzae MRE50]